MKTTCKLHTILEVAPSKKIRCLREKTPSIQAWFSVKKRAQIGPESDSERQRQEKPTKNASGDVSERTFSLAGPFWVDFGGLAGSSKSTQNGPENEKVRLETSLEVFFVRFSCRCRSESLSGPILARFVTENHA